MNQQYTEFLWVSHLFLRFIFVISQMFLLCSIVLNPRYKLGYFRKVKWEESWIETARQLVVEAFKYYTEDDIEEIEQAAACLSRFRCLDELLTLRWCLRA